RYTRAKLTAAATSAALRALTTYALGARSQAFSQPDTCVPPGWSPRKKGLLRSLRSAAQPAASLPSQGARSGETRARLPPTARFGLGQAAYSGQSASAGGTRWKGASFASRRTGRNGRRGSAAAA